MFSHISVGTSDFERARRFYEPVMATLGLTQPFQMPGAIAFGAETGPKLFILAPYDGGPPTPGNGTMAAFLAPSRAAVEAFHAAALANGGSDEGAPGLRPRYHANYYAAYVRDPDGNKLQAVCHSSRG